MGCGACIVWVCRREIGGKGVCVGVLNRGILVCTVWSRDQKKDCEEGDDEVMVKGGTV